MVNRLDESWGEFKVSSRPKKGLFIFTITMETGLRGYKDLLSDSRNVKEWDCKKVGPSDVSTYYKNLNTESRTVTNQD